MTDGMKLNICPKCKLPNKPQNTTASQDDLKKQQQSSKNESANSLLYRVSNRVPFLGILLSLMSSLTLGTAGMLVKLTTSVHGVQVAVFRALIQLVIYTLLIIRGRLSFFPEKSEQFAVMGRALFGGTSITASYFALKLIPLGDATTIRFSLPIWALIISYFFLGESCTLLKIGAVVCSITGVVLIAKPEASASFLGALYSATTSDASAGGEAQWLEAATRSINDANATQAPAEPGSGAADGGHEEDFLQGTTTRQLVGSLLALCSSVCLAISFVSLRLCRETRAEIVIFWLSLFSLLIGSTFLLASGEFRLPDNVSDVVKIALNGALGAVGQWCITSALKVEQSGVISLARTFDIVVAFCYSIVLLHEPVTVFSLSGAVLVCAGVLAVILPKWLCVPDKGTQLQPVDEADDVSEASAEQDCDLSANATLNTCGEKNKFAVPSFVEIQLSAADAKL